MNNELFQNQLHIARSNTISKLWGLIRWSLIRHKYLLPTFSFVQAAFSLAIVYGLALVIPEINDVSAIYLSSGALTLGIIAVGCVLAPQIVSASKQNGLFKYQKTLPVARSSILCADIIIWSIASLPGVIMGCIATILRFNINIDITPLSCAMILISQVTMICVGFSIAYWLPPNAMALATQLIMIGGLLFSPITYPVDKLPEWTSYLYNILPFVPASNLLRSSLFHTEQFTFMDLIVVIIWAIIAFILALTALSRKE